MSALSAQYASAFFALASAVLWFCTALVPMPRITVALITGGKRQAPPHEVAFRRQSLLNAADGLSAAVAALFQIYATHLSNPATSRPLEPHAVCRDAGL